MFERVALERVVAARAQRPLDADQRVRLAAALGRVVGAAEIDHDRGSAGVGDQIDAGAALERVVAGAAVEQVGAVAAVQRVVAAQALEVVVAGEAGQVVRGVRATPHVVVGGGAGRERLVQLDGAKVGQAASRLRPGGTALVEGACSYRVAGAQGGVGEVVAQRHGAIGAELAAASHGVDRGEEGAGCDILAVATNIT